MMILTKVIKLKFISLLRRNQPSNKYDRESSFFMNKNPKYKEYEIGNWTYGNPIVRKGDLTTHLVIGKYCSIGSGVQILLGGEHRKDWVTTYPFNVIFPEAKSILGHPASKGDIIIGNDVWIGLNAIILSGVTIGNGAIIGAGTIVVKNIPPYSIVVGNPPRIIGSRFPDHVIDELEKIQWWNWPEEKVVESFPHLLDNSIEKFLNIYSK